MISHHPPQKWTRPRLSNQAATFREIVSQVFCCWCLFSSLQANAAESFYSISDVLMPSPERQSGFGNSLSLDGETLLIGEPRVSGADINGTGVTHVYSRGAGGWQKDVEWMLPETVDSSSSEFGAGLAIDGNTAVVGAPRADHIIEQTVNPDGSVLTLAGDGLAFVYERTAGVWGEPLEFNPGERQAFGFGRSVAIRANLLAIGRTTSSSVGGEVYLYERDGDGWSEIAILEAVVQVSGD